ncbi:class I SAM-dependent methyltransferase [Pinisolibacter sp.]|uniref:class I SAM-dependent methyltransferase n=1 Tax=Pinisolibacter sp. TaxID=2172024 RepID=UPI002FDD3DF7
MPIENWSGGYDVGLEYVFDHHPEMDPSRVGWALWRAGLAAPEIRTACELGYGQGVGVVLHGTAGDAAWWGCDFMPGHTAGARDLARAGGAPITLGEDSFAEFAARDDLPMFDYVALHGVWSWVSAEDRRTIVAFLRRRLVSGGVVYISYNVRAGWSQHQHLRNLLKQFVERHTPAATPPGERIDAALDYLERLAPTIPASGASSMTFAESVAHFRSMDRRYLAHELLHDEWAAFDFPDVVRDLAAAKLTYAGSADLLDTVAAIGTTPEQADFLGRIDDPILREATRDVMIGRRFRHDLFVRGPRVLPTSRLVEGIRDRRVILTRPAREVFDKFSGAQGKGVLRKETYLALVAGLGDLVAHRIGDVFDTAAAPGTTLGQIFEAISVLVAMGDVALVQSDEATQTARPRTARLNAEIARRARDGSEISALASPITGGGIACDLIERLFVDAYLAGSRTSADWAEHARECLSMLGWDIGSDGDGAGGEADRLGELRQLADRFLADRLPQLRALGVVD